MTNSPLDAVERAVERIGEAASRVPAPIRAKYPEIPWADIIGTRHHFSHGYDSINYSTIWETIHNSIPRDRVKVAAALDAEKKRRKLEE